jgi:broad specificity phosphatase PhoE
VRRRAVICRHTQTDHNLARILSGQIDVPVNETGATQADNLAQQVGALGGIVRVIGSDLRRTTHLGTKICRQTGMSYGPNVQFREAGLGRLEGLRREEFPEEYRTDRFRTSLPTFDFTPVGGESAQQVVDRYLAAMRAATRFFFGARSEVARLVIIGHGTALRLVFRDHFGLIEKLHEQGEYQEVDWPF